VRYVRAGERILLDLASRGRAGRRPAIYRSNVDYSGSNAAWGTHESYLHEVEPSALPAQLIRTWSRAVVYAAPAGSTTARPGSSS
jgi:hypothetical protein